MFRLNQHRDLVTFLPGAANFLCKLASPPAYLYASNGPSDESGDTVGYVSSVPPILKLKPDVATDIERSRSVGQKERCNHRQERALDNSGGNLRSHFASGGELTQAY